MSQDALLKWFDHHARPFLDLYAPERVQPLVSDAKRLGELLKQPPETLVACLGNSGVGKSTLINALVAGDRQLLPAGGTGPLTALATTVRFGETPFFRAKYHRAKQVWKILFPIAAAVARSEGQSSPEGVVAEALEGGAQLFDEEEFSLLNQEATLSEGDDGGRIGHFIKMATKLVTGEQFAEVQQKYLVDSLRLALGRNPLYGNRPLDSHQRNVDRLKTALDQAEKDAWYERSQDGDGAAFMRDLKLHSVGNLAPLIAEIEVQWPSDLLRDGLVLVDLPGVGVAGDMYRQRTQEYVRDRARALLLVVDRAGMSEASVELLRSSGYWDRLVGAAYEPEADPCALLIAVTRVDDVVSEEFSAQLTEQRRSKSQLLNEIAGQMETSIQRQIAQQLAGIDDSSNEDLNRARRTAKETLLRDLQVFAVAAPDFRRILVNDDDDRPSVAKSPEQTRVPQLAESLRALAARMKDRRLSILQKVGERLTRGIEGELQIIETQWQDEARAASEAEKLREALNQAVRQWREELANRQGSFREFLQDVLQNRVAALVQDARVTAQDEIRKYLRSLRDAHWSTLRAAVRYGGTFHGARKIDLPNDLADRFQEPMAGVWGMRLLKDIRKRTQEYAEDCVKYVQKVCDWARSQGSSVNTTILERQEARIRDQAEQLRTVGKEAADELRAVVRSQVSKAIIRPIERRCEKFVEDGDGQGRGVKARILEMFDELADESARAAEAPARRILERRVEEVRAQIDQAFTEWQDPIQETVDAIVSTNEQRIRRADKKRREKVIAELAEVRRAAPGDLHTP